MNEGGAMGRKTSRGSNAWEHMRISKVTSQMARRSPLASSSGDAVFQSDGEVSTPPHPIYHGAPSTSPICTALNQIPNLPHPPTIPATHHLSHHPRTPSAGRELQDVLVPITVTSPLTLSTPQYTLSWSVCEWVSAMPISELDRPSEPFHLSSVLQSEQLEVLAWHSQCWVGSLVPLGGLECPVDSGVDWRNRELKHLFFPFFPFLSVDLCLAWAFWNSSSAPAKDLRVT